MPHLEPGVSGGEPQRAFPDSTVFNIVIANVYFEAPQWFFRNYEPLDRACSAPKFIDDAVSMSLFQDELEPTGPDVRWHFDSCQSLDCVLGRACLQVIRSRIDTRELKLTG